MPVSPSTTPRTFDVIVVGGGPAGSSCARFLTDAGKRVAIVDRAAFPRVKLCAGWLSNPVWTALGIEPSEYTGDLWKWNSCHVHFGDACHTVDVDGYFIRRVEFDDFLLRRCGAEVIEHQVKRIERDGEGGWIIDDHLRAPVLVGAGGTHCPVLRQIFGQKPARPAGARELEFEADPADVAATRAGLDGEPELYLHPDLRGYSWNIPKTDWLNVGTGTMEAKQVRDAWGKAREVFTRAGHIPASAEAALESMKGHSYYLFEPAHLERCCSGSALLVGDSLGLAHPFTAEGIGPAIVSARVAAGAIIDGDIASYGTRMKRHPLFAEYATLWRLRDTGGALRRPADKNTLQSKAPGRRRAEAATSWLVARGFAWMFAGRPLPGHRVIGPLIRTARRWDRLVSAATLERASTREGRRRDA